MEIRISNPYGFTTFTDIPYFDRFRNLVASGQRIQAIKFMREKEPAWGLKEAKEFVDYVSFPPEPVTQDDNPFAAPLREIKFDLREMIGQDYALTRDRVLDVYDKVVGLLKN